VELVLLTAVALFVVLGAASRMGSSAAPGAPRGRRALVLALEENGLTVTFHNGRAVVVVDELEVSFTSVPGEDGAIALLHANARSRVGSLPILGLGGQGIGASLAAHGWRSPGITWAASRVGSVEALNTAGMLVSVTVAGTERAKAAASLAVAVAKIGEHELVRARRAIAEVSSRGVKLELAFDRGLLLVCAHAHDLRAGSATLTELARRLASRPGCARLATLAESHGDVEIEIEVDGSPLRAFFPIGVDVERVAAVADAMAVVVSPAAPTSAFR
jgi:hypothetical protein